MACGNTTTLAAHGTGEVSSDLATLQGIAEEAGFRPLLMNAPDLDLAAKKLLLCPTGVRPVQA